MKKKDRGNKKGGARRRREKARRQKEVDGRNAAVGGFTPDNHYHGDGASRRKERTAYTLPSVGLPLTSPPTADPCEIDNNLSNIIETTAQRTPTTDATAPPRAGPVETRGEVPRF